MPMVDMLRAEVPRAEVEVEVEVEAETEVEADRCERPARGDRPIRVKSEACVMIDE